MFDAYRHFQMRPRTRGLGTAAAFLFAAATVFGPGTAQAGMFQERWDGALDSRATLSGSAFQTDGHIALTLAAGSQNGALTIADLDPGQAVSAFTLSTKIFIGGGSGADGMAVSFGDPTSIGNYQDGLGSGLAVTLDTFDNGGDTANAIELFYNGASFAVGPATTLRTGSYVPLDIVVHANGDIWVRHNGNAFQATIPSWTGLAGRQFVLSAATGGLDDEHSVEDLTIATIPSSAYFEECSASPTPDGTFYGNGRQDDFYCRLTDNSGSQQGSFIVPDQDPGVAIDSFMAQFEKFIDSGGGADGLSFSFVDLPAGSFG